MSQQLSFRCVNCHAELELPAQGAAGVRCPVCQFFNDVSSMSQVLSVTRDGLEHNLDALIAAARAGGLSGEEIVSALRDELEFAAEQAHFGRQICVQIIDLGPKEGQAAPQPVRDRASLLRGRAVGG